MSFALQQTKFINLKYNASKETFLASKPNTHMKGIIKPLKKSKRYNYTLKCDISSSNGSNTSMKPILNIEQIMERLPHRYPFLLVDRVTEMEDEKYIIGYKNVTVNDEFFNGHFPERKIMPGVLQVEALAQLAGILAQGSENKEKQKNFFFGGIESCRFKKVVVPGDRLMMKVNITKFNKKFGILKAHGEAFTDDEIACEADITIVFSKS